MDPTQTLRNLVDALKQSGPVDPDESTELIDALLSWLRRGGFTPEIRPADLSALLTFVRAAIQQR